MLLLIINLFRFHKHNDISSSFIFIYRAGDVTKLNTVAIVNSTNESLSVRGSLSERIHLAAGPDLLVECKQLQGKLKYTTQ